LGAVEGIRCMKIVVPMAGEGQRFKDAGYTVPKPFIPVEGVPMIEAVQKNLPFNDVEWIFLVREEHFKSCLFPATVKGRIIPVYEPTEGAACTVLLAKEHIDTDEELLIVNSDQLMEYRMENFNTLRVHGDADGIIWLFWATERKWSYAEVGELSCRVHRVAEKDPISCWATTGAYYWKRGKDFVNCAEHMITNDLRSHGEFYTCPVYNILIERGGKVLPFYVDEMWGLGTPEDLLNYSMMIRSPR
jgi:dTDP-glucose pyrophosphorylase